MKKQFTVYEIYEKFERLSSANKVEVLFAALSNMQSYNGRTPEECIAMAMGYYTVSNGKWEQD